LLGNASWLIFGLDFDFPALDINVLSLEGNRH
jgi:hypothetical protein